MLGIAAFVGALLTTQCQEATADSPTLTDPVHTGEREGNTQNNFLSRFLIRHNIPKIHAPSTLQHKFFRFAITRLKTDCIKSFLQGDACIADCTR